MTRILEVLAALAMVVVAAIIAGLFLPSSGHIQRSITVSGSITHVYDVLNNFRDFPRYSVLGRHAPGIAYTQSADAWYGPGTSVSWASSDPKVGDGTMKIVSATPGFNKVGATGQAIIVWSLANVWRGHDKRFTLHLLRTGRRENLVKITWAYDVRYGWNLLDRYAGLYIHGRPGTFIQYGLTNLQNLLAGIPDIDYAGEGGGTPLDPFIVATPATPVLFVDTSADRSLASMARATDKAVRELHAAMHKLGVTQAGPRVRLTTDYGERTVTFTVAVPIDIGTLTIDGHAQTLTAPPAPAVPGVAASVAVAAPAVVAGTPAVVEPLRPGQRDAKGAVVVNAAVRGMLAFGGRALEATCSGSPACVPITRLRLQAYAQTHGYAFDPAVHRLYDVRAAATGGAGADVGTQDQDQHTFKVYLPLSAGPARTPEQIAGLHPPAPPGDGVMSDE